MTPGTAQGFATSAQLPPPSGGTGTTGLLVATALVWLFSAWYARSSEATSAWRRSFWFFFVASAAANVGVVLARTAALFYVFYASMTFSSYGLIAAKRTDAALRAGRVYLVTALGAEVLLLGAFWFLVRGRIDVPLSDVPGLVAEAPRRDLIVSAILVGFGVKAGLVPLHFWLPLAHPVAPTPASAALSGAIVGGGIVGLLRFLPLGAIALPRLGVLVSALGMTSAVAAAVVGTMQRDPKTVLAYSTVSQSGFVFAALGAGLARPEAAAATRAAVALFVLHHGLAKAALFLGTDVLGRAPAKRRWLATSALAIPALAIAGAPGTSGALAKHHLKELVPPAHVGADAFEVGLGVAAIGSTLLMLRFGVAALSHRPRDGSPGPAAGEWLPWALLVAMGVVPFVYASAQGAAPGAVLQASELWAAAWPMGAGLAIGAGIHGLRRGAVALPARIPPGDVIVVLEAALQRARELPVPFGRAPGQAPGQTVSRRAEGRSRRKLAEALGRLQRFEARLGRAEAIGALLLLLLALFALTTR